MINIIKSKISSIFSLIKFFEIWFNLFSLSFLFYILLTFLATILEGVSIISLIPLIQSIQFNNLENNEISGYNLYFIRLKESLGLNTTDLIILFFFLQIFKILITHFTDILLFRKTSDVQQKMQSKIIDNLSNILWIDYLKVSTGKINNLISFDSSRAARMFQILCLAINHCIFIFIYFFSMFFISVKATVIVIVFGFFSFLVLRFFANYTYESGKKLTKSTKDYLDLITDIFLQMKPLKTSNYINFVKDKINVEIFNFRDAQVFQRFMAVGISFFQNLILIILFGFIIIFFLQKGNTYFAESFVFIFVSYRLSQQLMQFQVNINKGVAFIPSLNHIKNFFLKSNERKEIQNFGNLKTNFEKIYFSNVECKIEKKIIFKNINFEITKKSFIAIIGRSGIGKSSLIDMIVGLITPSKGNIFVNKINLNKIDIKYWRSKISYVPQEHFLLKDNIKNNIILNEKFNQKRFRNILNLLELDDLDTESPLSEKGSSLSIGQKQRVSIARALYSNREIIILDEPTSNLNALLEKKILFYIKKNLASKTVIMVTHNQSAVKYATTVYKITKNGINKI